MYFEATCIQENQRKANDLVETKDRYVDMFDSDYIKLKMNYLYNVKIMFIPSSIFRVKFHIQVLKHFMSTLL